MLRRSLASAALRPLAAAARLSTAAGSVPVALPKFMVTTVAPKSQDGAKFVFDRYSKESSKLPVFLMDVKYEDKASVAGKWVDPSDPGKGKEWTLDKGEDKFSGTAVSQAEP